MPSPRYGAGLTLVELLVTLSIMGILLAIAVPSYQDAVLGSKLSSYANSLVASAQIAKSEAIKRNSTVTLCASSSGTACTTSGDWGQGWIVIVGTTVLQRQQALPSGMRVSQSGGTSSLTFQPTGVGTTQATFTVCRYSPAVGNQEKSVTISTTGSGSVSTPATVSSCS